MKKNIPIFSIFILILMIAILTGRLYWIKNIEVIDTKEFTDYFQENEADNGGLELLSENFTTFKEEYNFIDEVTENLIEKKIEIIKYTIVSGDTLEKISKKFNISTDTIKINNSNLKSNSLKIGEVLSFPSCDGFFYTIKKNDNFSKIAKLYGVKVSDIVEYNDISPKKLIAGKKLFIHNVSYKKYMKIKMNKTEKSKTKSKIEEKNISQKIESTNSNDSTSSFGFPVRYVGISSPFGNRFHPVLKRYILHTGVDLIAKYVPLRASKAGVVTFAGYMKGYGKIIIIKHSNNYETRYAHLSVISTKVGEYVKKGELIGKTGASGRVTGPHLHFEIRKNGKPLNPMKFL